MNFLRTQSLFEDAEKEEDAVGTMVSTVRDPMSTHPTGCRGVKTHALIRGWRAIGTGVTVE